MSTTVVVPARDYIVPVFEDRDRTYTTTYDTGLLKINATDYLLIDAEVLKTATYISGDLALISLASQPTTPQYLTFTMTDVTNASAWFTVTGTDANGGSITEKVYPAVGAGPTDYTTTLIYKTVITEGISCVLLGGATMAVTAKNRLILQDTSGTPIQAPSVVVPFRDYTIPVPERLTHG